MHLARIREIFCACLKCPTLEERITLLRKEVAGDANLETAVRALLDAHEGNESFLEQPLNGLLSGEPLPEIVPMFLDIHEGPGTQIGPYKLREQIGEGGFGLVYVAEQEQPVRRKVALKIIKPGMDTREVIARFEAERQTLALMDHPNMAKVLDAGTTETGRPYFVMELVKGIPITEILRRSQAFHARAAGIVRRCLSGRATRASEGHHSPGFKTHQRDGHAAR